MHPTTNRSPTRQDEGSDIRKNVHFVDLGHSITPKRILCSLHVNKLIMTYYPDRNLYHCSSSGNIFNPAEEANKPALHQDQEVEFLNDPYNSENLTANNGQRSTSVAFAFDSPYKRKQMQSIEDSQDKDSIVYSSGEEACKDD